MNINDLGAMAVSSVVQSIFDLHLCFYFIKYCKEIPGDICVLISPHELGAMTVSSVVQSI